MTDKSASVNSNKEEHKKKNVEEKKCAEAREHLQVLFLYTSAAVAAATSFISGLLHIMVLDVLLLLLLAYIHGP